MGGDPSENYGSVIFSSLKFHLQRRNSGTEIRKEKQVVTVCKI